MCEYTGLQAEKMNNTTDIVCTCKDIIVKVLSRRFHFKGKLAIPMFLAGSKSSSIIN